VFTTLNYARGNWNVTLRHQYWPSILDSTYAEGLSGAVNPYGGVDESYQLIFLGAGLTFADRYRLSFGIDNLLDQEPPLTGGNPNQLPFPIAASHATSSGTGGLSAGGSPVYEPLGRRAFFSMTMDF
jgi:outer membrane receptor protein involved in Fe transport